LLLPFFLIKAAKREGGVRSKGPLKEGGAIKESKKNKKEAYTLFLVKLF